MKGCIVPNDAYPLVGVLMEELLHSLEYFITVLPGRLIEMTLVVLLIQETNVALGLFLAVNLDDGSLTFFEPAFTNDSLLVHTYLVSSEDFPGVAL